MREMSLLFPGGLSKALTLSYDDGVEQDIRLIEIMNKHGLKGTFNLSGGLFAPEGTVYPQGQIHRRMSKSTARDLYTNCGQEIALHAYTHPDLTLLSAGTAVYQIVKDREALEDMFGRIVRGMAYPYGTNSAQTADLLRHCGVAYCRTVEATCRFDLPGDWLRLPSTCHHDHPRLMELANEFLAKPNFHWSRPKLFYLWGHSYEFEANNNWHVIEDFAALVGGKSDIWYATNIQICDYVAAWKGLITSADGRRVFNPSHMPLWLWADGKIYQVESGETILLD